MTWTVGTICTGPVGKTCHKDRRNGMHAGTVGKTCHKDRRNDMHRDCILYRNEQFVTTHTATRLMTSTFVGRTILLVHPWPCTLRGHPSQGIGKKNDCPCAF